MRNLGFQWGRNLVRRYYQGYDFLISSSSVPVLRLHPWQPSISRGLFLSVQQAYSTESHSELPVDLLRIMEQRMIAIEQRSSYLQEQINQATASAVDYSRANKELRKLGSSMELIKELRTKEKEIDGLKSVMSDCVEDKDMWNMAAEELAQALVEERRLQHLLLKSLLPKDDADARDCILEGLVVKKPHCLQWTYSKCEASGTISGPGAYGRLKFESGVHRVQRVPVTEKSGRVHTSAVSIAILPQADEVFGNPDAMHLCKPSSQQQPPSHVDVQLRNEDLKIDTYRSGGSGGQSVNTTNSAVRITHIPTGMTVAIQDERSQHMNKAKALKVLRARLYETERSRLQRSRSKLRAEQIGSGDRSERIRTYNFPQGRVTDHRVGITHHSIEDVMGGESLDMFVDALLLQEEMDAIASFGTR
ncbi:peptide chain release factor [Musa troglodytarum]|uniref:Peptide chain release factor n=1 Tax=Musa troglodytarum TaxID=320322 RepID=A0A9E7GKL5_9LILI|nr:peptide chain release factor [Musa troglodytarum]